MALGFTLATSWSLTTMDCTACRRRPVRLICRPDLIRWSSPIFDNGGGDGLQVTWQGPLFGKQKIAADRLSVDGGETLHDVAIRALASIPGHDAEKTTALATLIKAGKHRPSSIKALRRIPSQRLPEKELRPLVDNLIGYLSEMPARYRTSGPCDGCRGVG